MIHPVQVQTHNYEKLHISSVLYVPVKVCTNKTNNVRRTLKH